jgi:predicted DNA-binding protein (UPF0251 family)
MALTVLNLLPTLPAGDLPGPSLPPAAKPVAAKRVRFQSILAPQATEGLEAPWNARKALAVASARCSLCLGAGVIATRSGARICRCVYRAVFRVCLNKWRDIRRDERRGDVGGVHFARQQHRRAFCWSRPREEYCADFELLARRVLNAAELRLFRLHELEGVQWPDAAPRLGLSRGNFFHAVYRVEERLGRAFSETRPYGLYPVDEYFGCYGKPRMQQEHNVWMLEDW